MCLGALDDPVRLVAGGPDDLGAGEELVSLHPCGPQDGLRLLPALGEHILAVGHHPGGALDLQGDVVPKLLQTFDKVLAVDHRRRGERNGLRRSDLIDHGGQLLSHIHRT